MPKKAIIIGAGPAGLTAAYELLKRTDIVPIILEKSGEIGGISRTTNYKGNRMDMGPHRFFSKSDRVMDWWLKMMPLEGTADKDVTISYQNKTREINAENAAPKDPDKVMLVIQRLTRIYFLRKFFAYPIQLTLDTLKTLGLIRTIKIMFSFLWIRLFPRKPEKSLEDFIINKFGRQLYLLFFKDYTEKVWGIAPSEISAEWGAQRIKGVSLSKAIASALKSLRAKRKGGISQKDTETSLIEQFLYPKYGPGSLWEEVARQVQEMGGKIFLHQDVQRIYMHEEKIQSVNTVNSQTGQTGAWEGDYFFSTMPVQELIAGMGSEVPRDVQEVAAGLQYRDFINVGILLKQLSTKEGKKLELKDNWIYIQERDVKVGRLMIYNNWGGGMIKDPHTTWIGMEYFCNKTDAFWGESDDSIQRTAIHELEKMDLARAEDVLDSTVRRMEKTYPAYFGTYEQFDKIRAYTDRCDNLFLVGRNGMHKYNNADHSMLCAMVAVDNIEVGITAKDNLWSINTEQEYHEEKKRTTADVKPVSTEPAIANLSRAAMTGELSFKDFLWKDSWNKTLIKIAGIAIVFQFIIFKYLYPQAGFINGDSYVYLETAFWNMPINTYPVGYSNFLRVFSAFTNRDIALIAFQYLFLQATALFLIFTLFYFYNPSKFIKIVLALFMVGNPIFLYLSNYVSSDAFFIAISLLWFTLLLWIVERPSIRLIVLQVLLLFYIFSVRYNALYYPVITALALILSRQKAIVKIAGITASFAVIGLFMWNTSFRYHQLTGIRQFSPFTGWQLANNALYAYRYVDSKDVKPAPGQYRELDKMVRHYFDTSKDLITHPQEMWIASTWYMWDPQSPLQIYMQKSFKKDSLAPILKKWATIGPLYSGYGNWLIRQYPRVFAEHYLLPNAAKFYAPPIEFLDTYNMGRDSVEQIAMSWFGYKDKKVKTVFKDFKVTTLNFYPILAGVLHVTFLFGFLFFGMLNGFRKSSRFSRILLLAGSLWLINFGFSVFASPVALRYQVFPVLVSFSFALFLLRHVWEAAFSPDASRQGAADSLGNTTRKARIA